MSGTLPSKPIYAPPPPHTHPAPCYCSLKLTFVAVSSVCAPTAQLGQLSGLEAKIEFSRNSLIGTLPTEIGNWVKLQNGFQVTTYNTHGNSMTGKIPTELGRLGRNFTGCEKSDDDNTEECTMFYGFDLGRNSFSGNVPTQLGQLRKIRSYFGLHSNELCGTIPAEVSALSSQIVAAGSSFWAVEAGNSFGTACPTPGPTPVPTSSPAPTPLPSLPPTSAPTTPSPSATMLPSANPTGVPTPQNLIALAALYKATNGTTWFSKANWMVDDPCTNYPTFSWYGVTCLSGSQKVVKLQVQKNNLVGTVPSEIALLSELTQNLRLYQNSLRGTIPTELGTLSKVAGNFLLYTSHFTGPLPTELGALTNLKWGFQPQGNSLTGTMPSQLGNLKEMVSGFNLIRNSFTGTVPSEFGKLTGMTGTFRPASNMLFGTLPTQLGRLSLMELKVEFAKNRSVE